MTKPTTAHDYYNPAKDDAKLQAMVSEPQESFGVPSRWIRCMAAEILALRSSATASEKRVQELEAALKDGSRGFNIALAGCGARNTLLDEALRQMSDFHASFYPANDADLTPRTSPAALRRFVDALASLHYQRHRL